MVDKVDIYCISSSNDQFMTRYDSLVSRRRINSLRAIEIITDRVIDTKLEELTFVCSCIRR